MSQIRIEVANIIAYKPNSRRHCQYNLLMSQIRRDIAIMIAYKPNTPRDWQYDCLLAKYV